MGGLIFFGLLVSLVPLSCLKVGDLPTYKFTLVYEGYLPTSIDNRSFEPANLLGERQEFIVVRRKFCFEIFQFTNNDWKSFYKIPFIDRSLWRDKTPRNIPWSVGDLNNNGKEEIIICIDKTIKRYEWDGEQFKEIVYKFSYLVDDILIGDVNNDDLNELVLFCFKKPLDSEPHEYYLCIVRGDEEGLQLLWTDKGRFGYVNPNFMPPDSLVCIADVMNIGSNQLLVARAQSDVSPTIYDLLIWKKGKLRFVKSFIILKRALVNIKYSLIYRYLIEVDPFSIGCLIPIKIEGKTMLLTSMVCPDTIKHKEVIVKIENNRLSASNPIFIHSGCSLPNRVDWIDLDGKGKGILRVIHLRSGKFKYMFYRF